METWSRQLLDWKWAQVDLTEPFTDGATNGSVKSFDQLIDNLWLDFIKNIEHRNAKDSFKEALVATIEWSKQKKGS